jgi:tRNA G18 (ribose-2'-O)-methylase SpoU
MPVINVQTLDDPRLAAYRALKDRELARDGERFIAEGEIVVRRLLASSYTTESVLLSERRSDEIAPIVPADVPVYVVPNDLVHDIIGFKFHSGVIACGRRKLATSLDDVLPANALTDTPLTLVILAETANAENMGSMIRLCAAFGVDALVLGEHSCDPFWRQSVRVSMGTIFSVPIVRSDDLLRDMRRLQTERAVALAATVLDPTAQDLHAFERPKRLAILFGNEAQGLDAHFVRACDHRITIPMRRGTDSLNVAVAAGIFLYEMT